MVKLNFVVRSVVITLAFTLSLCDANDDDGNPKFHIVYLGSLPETKASYSPTSHHLNMLQQVLDGSNPTKSLVRSYKRSFNGFAAMLTNQQAAKLTEMEGVVSVFPSKTLQTQTTRSWDFLGLPKAPKGHQTVETNLVVGFLDTGVWPESESFSDKGIREPVPKHWKGICAGGLNFTCNKKLIGARFYVENSARDNIGHGSHTASTAAGKTVDNGGFYGIAGGTARGAVPSSRIAAYKVCSSAGCQDHDILAAFDDAIADGVDVISVSLSGTIALRLDTDSIAIGSFHAMAKGVVVVQSAGNYGPLPGTVSSVAPWVITVAANTIDRKIVDKVVLGNGKALTGIPVINPFEPKRRTIPIALSNGNTRSCFEKSDDQCACLDEKSVKGKIILCEYYLEKDVLFSGAAGAIGKASDLDNVASNTLMPSVTLLQKDYAIVKSYKNSTKHPSAKILKSESAQDHNAPKVVAFSGRGPNPTISEILKPDISAPGVNILAAFSPIGSPTEDPSTDNRSVHYNILSGTSMSCPHVSGIAAYVKSFHPHWSTAAIKSAIMTSAKPMVRSSVEDVGEYAYGSGQANPILAINPGLVYDINKEDYVQMLCNLGYDNRKIKVISGELNACKGAAHRSLVRNLNYPTFAAHVRPMVPFNVRFGRIVTNVGLANSSYTVTITPNPQVNITVTPKVLSFKALNEKKSFVVKVVGKIPHETVVISSIVWSDATHHVRSPIVIDVSVP
ncbi:subtilisin-like protease SBT4.3 [Arachis stenosperma]|uniref:subtilisin-like protease SBT4.3 n=1 Tax=Arachis stenosperma TaxID=217475 RepID=UPI0025AC18B3|nr:subtilisin-like protease SBT4.3 [Arachis stenosperma]